MNTWRALLTGDAEEQVVVRAQFLGQVLAIVGCTMLAVSVVGLLLVLPEKSIALNLLTIFSNP